MPTVIYDQNEILGTSPEFLALTNRGLYFGESPFTSLVFDQGFVFLEEHLLRLEKMVDLFWDENWNSLKNEILFSLKKLNLSQRSYVRITLFKDRKDGVHHLIHSEPLEKVANSPIKLALAKGRRHPSVLPSFVKVGNYLESMVEKKMAKEQGFDDVLFLDNQDFIAEASSSNIFFRIGDVIKTPSLSSCLLEGITRSELMNCLKKENIKVEQGPYSLEELKAADEIWLSNGVRGLIPVQALEDVTLDSEWFQKMDHLFSIWKNERRTEV